MIAHETRGESVLYHDQLVKMYYRQSVSIKVEQFTKRCNLNESVDFEIHVTEELLKFGISYFVYDDIHISIPSFEFDGKTIYGGYNATKAISIPLKYPELRASPPPVELVSRSRSSMSFKLSPSWGDARIAGYSPLYHVMQLAVFTEPFWDRYQDIWWFKGGESHIVGRMFKTVYQGDSPDITIETKAFAASIRVAACNPDGIGPFGQPLILRPLDLKDSDTNDPGINSSIEYHKAFTEFYSNFEPLWDESEVKYMLKILWHSSFDNDRELYQHLEKESFRLHTSNFVILVMLKAVERIEALADAANIKVASVLNLAAAFKPIRRISGVFTKDYSRYRDRVLSILACEKVKYYNM